MLTKLMTEVRAYRVEYFCECGGEMASQGFYQPTNPPKYPHECKECGHRESLPHSYPRIEYK